MFMYETAMANKGSYIYNNSSFALKLSSFLPLKVIIHKMVSNVPSRNYDSKELSYASCKKKKKKL